MALLLWGLAGTSAISAAVTVTAVPNVQSPVDTGRWLCSLCPYRQGWYGALDIGLGYVDSASLSYADYRGPDERGAFPALDGGVHYRDSGDHYVDVHGRNLGIDSRSLEMRGGLRGRYQLRLAYHEIPKYRGFGTASVYTGVGSGSLGLPANWQKSFTTEGMTALDSSLEPVALETRRRTLQGGLTLKFGRKWMYDADFSHETKDGTRPFAAGLYTINSSQFPVPVDFTTDRFDLGLQYRGEHAQLRLGFDGSRFDNGVDSITWENPFSSAPGNGLLRAALEPDNTFYQFSLQAAFAPQPRLRFSGRAALGRMRQDDLFLPYSINPQFGDLTLPRSMAGTRIDTGTLNVAGKLAANLTSHLDFSASMKIDRRDNDSPVDIYTIVITDFIPGGDRLNRPYSFERQKYDFELGYRAAAAVAFRAGARVEQYERSLQSVLETDERLYWGELNFSRWSAVQLRVKLESSQRNASPYRQVDKTGLIENPLMRKFDYADRNRDRATVDVDISPDQPWSFNLSWSRAQDDFTKSIVGLRRSEEENLSADLGVSLSPGISLNAFASRDNISSALSGFDGATESPWDAITHDRITTLGLGISGRVSERVTLGLDWMESMSSGRISVIASSVDQPFPELRTRFGNVRAHVSFPVTHNWNGMLSAEHEHVSSNDWQLDGLGAAGISNVLSLGGAAPHHSITEVRVQASYRF